MERLNLEGGDPAPRVMRPKCLSLSELGNLEVDHLVDVRGPLAFASGHLPESMNLPVGMISAFAGWFFREGERIALVASDEDQLEAAMTHLTRIALDRVVGGYVGVVPAAAQGKAMRNIPMIGTAEVERRLASEDANWTLLDVRDADERSQGAIDRSQHIYIGELNERFRDLDQSEHYTLMCASGMRATVAAGWIASHGFEKLDVYLGSMGAWKAAHCDRKRRRLLDLEVERRLAGEEAKLTLRYVRDADERSQGAIDRSQHIYIGELNERVRDLDQSEHYTVMCASGMRATVAAGWLASRGFEKLDVYLGSMGAWKAAHC